MDRHNLHNHNGEGSAHISTATQEETRPLLNTSQSSYASVSSPTVILQEEDTRLTDSATSSGHNVRLESSSGNHVTGGNQRAAEISKETVLDLSKHPEYISQHDLGGASDSSYTSETSRDESAPLIDFPHRTCIASYRRLLIPFLLYCTAMGAVAVPKLHVIIDAMCRQYGEEGVDALGIGSDSRYIKTTSRATTFEAATSLHGSACDTPEIQERMARFLMYANIISGVLCAFSGPRIGKLADRYGRKPLLAFTAFGLLFGDVLSMAVIYFPEAISVHWILLEYAVGGATGTFAATMAVIQAYTADCTNGSERASAYSILHACMFLGVAFGPSLGELFTQYVGGGDMLAIFYVALACHAAFIVFVLVGIPESLLKHADLSNTTSLSASCTPQDASNASTWQAFVAKTRKFAGKFNLYRSLKILRTPPHDTPYTTQTNLLLLACIDAIAFGIQLGLPHLLILYAEHQLQWTRMEANLFISVTNATRAIALLLVLPGLARFFPKPPRSEPARSISAATGENEETVGPDPPAHSRTPTDNVSLDIAIIRIALFCDMLSFIGFVISAGPILFTMSGVIAASGALASPTIQSLMTNCVEPERAGELLGAVTLIHAVAKSIIPAGVQLIYSLTISRAPATVFAVLASIFGISLFLSLFIRRRSSIGNGI